MTNPQTLTVALAAARVNRARRTIERWIADGDLEVIEVRNAKGDLLERRIRVDALLSVYRQRLQAPRGGKGKPRRAGA